MQKKTKLKLQQRQLKINYENKLYKLKISYIRVWKSCANLTSDLLIFDSVPIFTKKIHS